MPDEYSEHLLIRTLKGLKNLFELANYRKLDKITKKLQ